MKLLGIAAIIIALAIGYYFVIYLPQRDAAQQATLKAQQIERQTTQLAQEAKKEQQKTDLDNCLAKAEDDYNSNWTNNCKTSGINTLDANCNLPLSTADSIEQYRKNEKADCFKEYPQN